MIPYFTNIKTFLPFFKSCNIYPHIYIYKMIYVGKVTVVYPQTQPHLSFFVKFVKYQISISVFFSSVAA